jgi:hypothetical protein
MGSLNKSSAAAEAASADKLEKSRGFNIIIHICI